MKQLSDNLFLLSFLLLFFTFSLAGFRYAGNGATGRTNKTTADSLHYPQMEKMHIFEKSFRPSEYDSDIQLKTKNDSAISQKDSSSRSFTATPDTISVAPPDTVQGYRIQVLATNDFDEATAVRASLNAALPNLWVYVVYDAPTYKVRVGDYLSRTDAYFSLDSLVTMGYKDAWIVPDKVIKNPPPKPSSPSPSDTVQTKK